MKRKLMMIGVGSSLCAAALVGSILYNHGDSSAHAGTITDTAVLNSAYLEDNYGIKFVQGSQASASSAIPESEAIQAVEHQFMNSSNPIDLTATFGYISTDTQAAHQVFAPGWTEAGKKNHGILSDQPVWVVRLPNQPIIIVGKHGGQPVSSPGTTTYYSFVDATNGQVLFTNTVPEQ